MNSFAVAGEKAGKGTALEACVGEGEALCDACGMVEVWKDGELTCLGRSGDHCQLFESSDE